MLPCMWWVRVQSPSNVPTRPSHTGTRRLPVSSVVPCLGSGLDPLLFKPPLFKFWTQPVLSNFLRLWGLLSSQTRRPSSPFRKFRPVGGLRKRCSGNHSGVPKTRSLPKPSTGPCRFVRGLIRRVGPESSSSPWPLHSPRTCCTSTSHRTGTGRHGSRIWVVGSTSWRPPVGSRQGR